MNHAFMSVFIKSLVHINFIFKDTALILSNRIGISIFAIKQMYRNKSTLSRHSYITDREIININLIQ